MAARNPRIIQKAGVYNKCRNLASKELFKNISGGNTWQGKFGKIK